MFECALNQSKYAPSAFGIVPYAEASPLSGNVPPSRICFFEIPGSVAGLDEPPAAAAAAATRASAARTAKNLNFLRICRLQLNGWFVPADPTNLGSNPLNIPGMGRSKPARDQCRESAQQARETERKQDHDQDHGDTLDDGGRFLRARQARRPG